MKRFLSGCLLLVFLYTSVPITQAEDDVGKKMEAAGKKVKDLMEKYEKASTTKYNEIDVTVKDTDGNPRDCTVRIYYNDYKQEKFSSSGGSFSGQFDHGKTAPTKVLSVAVSDCPCRLIKMDQSGPVYPEIEKEIEKIKIVIEDEIGGAITDKLSEYGKEVAEKALTKFFDGMGYAGSKAAGSFLAGFGVGAEMGAPVRDFINKKVDEIFDAVREEARKSHDLTKDDTPVRNRVNVIKPRWKIRNILGLTKPASFTKYKFDLLLQCPKGAKEPKSLVWKPTKWLKPITPPITPPPVRNTNDAGETVEETIEEFGKRMKERNQRLEQERKEQEAEDARRAEERAAAEAKRKAEEEAKRKAEAEAKAKAERIAKECKKCDTIKQALEAKRGEYDDAWEDLGDVDSTLTDMRRQTSNLKKKLAQAQAKSNDFNDPGTDYVESGGRRIDATDIALRNAAAELGWQRYQAGEIGAQDLSDYWQGLDGDAVDALRAKVKADLAAAVKAAEEAVANNEKATKDQETKRQEAVDHLNETKTEMEKLERAYKDCLKKCQDDKKVNVAKDYGVTVVEEKPKFGWLPWNWGEEVITEVNIDHTIIDLVGESTDDPAPESKTEFQSVMDEISAGPILVNQQQIGQTGQMINVGTQAGNGGLGAALQILIEDDADPVAEINFKTKKQGDPDANRYDFGIDGDPVDNEPNSFVLEFSKAMDTDTVEDNFIIRSFGDEPLTANGPTFTEEAGFGGKVWDETHFDVDWNSDDTEATFTFKEERALDPPAPKKVIIIIIIDRRTSQTGLVNNVPEYFGLPDNNLNDVFVGAPPIFSDGFESGTPSAWQTEDPDAPIGGGGFSGDEIDESSEIDELIEEEVLDSIREIYSPPAAENCAGTREYESEDCSGSCGSGEQCRSAGTGCYECFVVCAPGHSTTSNCANRCSNVERCAPVDTGNRCFDCVPLAIDLDPNLDIFPEYRTPQDEPLACVPDCSESQCGDDGCGGSCGECGNNENCVSGQCEGPPEEPAAQCPINTSDQTQCNQNCDGECSFSEDVGGLSCYSCIEADPAPSCPANSIPDEGSCNSQCDNGLCTDSGAGCYSCTQCPSGSFSVKSECEADGSSCSVGGSQGELSCWVPQASCEDLCSQNGFSATEIDFSTDLEAQLNGVSCVSSYQFNLQQATVGDCQCYPTDAPTVNFDMTPPICTGSICGDVTCGESVSCPVDGGTATATCNWGGWQRQGQYQYQPVIGQ